MNRRKLEPVRARPMEPLFARPAPYWKRACDIALSLAVLGALSPLLLGIALYVKLVSRGPVFFRQRRVGFQGREFLMYKFRSMHLDGDTSLHERHVTNLIRAGHDHAPMHKLDDDPRIIPGGRLIRKLCLDELPQLFNVVKGDMSIVGPRPPVPYEVEAYRPWHRARFDCLPGMTGLWQVSGKNALTFQQMVGLDIRYVRTMSPWLDIKILLKTPFAILAQLRRRPASTL